MKVEINQPVGFTEVGQRTNNEDSVFPSIDAVNTQNRLFLVCDGVGGQLKGEVASSLACESIGLFFEQNPVQVADEQYISKALQFTVDNFIKKELEDKETEGMATTMTLLHFNEAGATIAHLGDSRIYQIRNGQVLHVSKDHKLVNELVREGHITEEEALNHSQRNVITKVISADRNDVPDVQIITNILAGDYFFLCSDGVLEQIYDDLLAYHLRETDDNNIDVEQKMENIRLECQGQTRDNFSAYLIRINSVSGKLLPGYDLFPKVGTTPGFTAVPPQRAIDIRANYVKDAPTEFTRSGLEKLREFDNSSAAASLNPSFQKSSSSGKSKVLPYFTGIAIGILATAGGVLYWKNSQKEDKSQTVILTESVPKHDTIIPVTVKNDFRKPEEKVHKQEKEGELVPSSQNTFETLEKSKDGKFYIIKDAGKYYVWEPFDKKKSQIDYKDITSITGIVLHYKLISSNKHYLYLVKPDIKIIGIDPDKIETSDNQVIYFAKGKEHIIDPANGKDILPSVKDLQQKLKEQNSGEPK